MKKFTLIALIGCIFSSSVYAQYNRRYSNNSEGHNTYTHKRQFYDNPDVYYGLRLGLAVATVNSDDAQLDGGNGMSGLNVGFVIGAQLSDTAPICLESGLYYTEKGGKGYYLSKKFTYDLNYLTVPIIAKYKYEVEDNILIQPFFGGYLAYGIGGKIKDYGDRVSESSFSNDEFKRFDGGLRIGCGASYQNLYTELGYDIGLANICHDSFDTSHTDCLYINIGVDF